MQMSLLVEKNETHPLGQEETYQYVHGASADSIYRELSEQEQSSAQFHAGWIALEEAFSSLDHADFWLSRYQLSLERSQRLANDLFFDLKAGAMVLEYPVYKEMLKGNLPPRDMALCLYNEMTDYAASVVNDFQSSSFDSATEMDKALHGFKSEVAVMLLACRFPLAEDIPTESWFPMFSFPSDTFTGSDSYGRKQGHNINVYTNNFGRAGVVYRAQVVSSSAYSKTDYAPSIKVVNVKEDLALIKGEARVDDRIILGCYEELHGTGTQHTSAVLDYRTNKLLDILG